jgi:GTPase
LQITNVSDSKTMSRLHVHRTTLLQTYIHDCARTVEEYLGRNHYDCRIAVMGHVDAGKSTLIGVLSRGLLDNGRGLARSYVLAHPHELESGRTTSATHHLIGYTEEGKPVYQTGQAASNAAQKDKSWTHIIETSSSHVTLVDLPGHKGYLKNAIAGLLSHHVHFTIVVMNASKGVEKMTKAHLKILCAMHIPFACVWTKLDMTTKEKFMQHDQALKQLLRSDAFHRRRPLTIRDSTSLDWLSDDYESNQKIVPVFNTSSVKDISMSLIHTFLQRLSICSYFADRYTALRRLPLRMEIQDVWKVPYVGLVVSAHVFEGTLKQDAHVVVGPFEDDSFRDAYVSSIEYKRTSTQQCTSGDSCTIALRSREFELCDVRRGMIVLNKDRPRTAVRSFQADVYVLHHATTIKIGFQSMIHCNSIRQSACIDQIYTDEKSDEKSNQDDAETVLRSGSRARVMLRFMNHSEYVTPGTIFLFREGEARGVGQVVSLETRVAS